MDKVEGQKVSLKVPLGKAEGFCTRRDTSCSNDLGMDEKRLRLSVSISRRFSVPRPSGSSDIPMQANYLYRSAWPANEDEVCLAYDYCGDGVCADWLRASGILHDQEFKGCLRQHINRVCKVPTHPEGT